MREAREAEERNRAGNKKPRKRFRREAHLSRMTKFVQFFRKVVKQKLKGLSALSNRSASLWRPNSRNSEISSQESELRCLTLGAFALQSTKDAGFLRVFAGAAFRDSSIRERRGDRTCS